MRTHARTFVIACTALTALTAQTVVARLGAQSSNGSPVTARDLLGVVSHQIGDLSDDGQWMAVLASTRLDGFGTDFRRDGDPSYLRPAVAHLLAINTASGESRPVFAEGRVLRNPTWSPDATLLGVLVARNDRLEPVIWDRRSGRARTLPVPAGWYVAENSDVLWTHDGRRIVVALRSDAWKQHVAKEFVRMTDGPVFVQDGRDPFMAWDRIRREGNVRAVYMLDVANGEARQLLPETMVATYRLSADDSLLTWEDDITPRTDYDVISGTDRRLLARAALGGTTTTLLPSLKGVTLSWSDDGRQLAWSRDGRVWVRSVAADGVARQVAGRDSAAARGDTLTTTPEERSNDRFAVVRWSPTGETLLLSNRQGFWTVPSSGGERTLVAAASDSARTPRYAPVGWSADGRSIYFTINSRSAWERAIARFDRTDATWHDVTRDARLYSGARLSRRGDVLVYSSGEGNRPLDLYATDAQRPGARRLTDGNPQLAGKAMAITRLLTYRDTDGATRYGVAYLPADYREGTRYPTLFNIYEEFFDDTFDPTINVLTSRGYIVVKPSVGFETGFPGEAWAKGVTAAANHLIDAGIADSARLGVFGTSYGGYATNLLITQTHRFRAAVNISGKVDMVSFYTDSPRLGVRNIHAAEKSQDRLGATLWEQPQKYVAQSAIFFADRITTPLLLMTGAQDSNVPADNTREMYYALRRLGKDVTWVDYMNSGHGTPSTTADDFLDFHTRMLAFFDRYLKGTGDAPAPERVVEARSLLGESLSRPVPPAATLARMEAQLAEARRAYAHTPTNADSIIWLGRRTAYPGHFNEAIAIFTLGIARFPDDARFYRHRGHRYLTTRQLEKAIADLERAYALTKGTPDQVEPDGQPNARNIPTSTLQGNIRYHLALAYYLSGDFARALPFYVEDVAASAGNPDMLVASSHWLYMTLRRLGRTAEAARVLVPIRKDMDVIENGAYHRLLLLYKGELSPDELLRNFGSDGGLEDITTAYGVGNWHLYNGRRAEGEAIFRRIVEAQSQWASFGYLAAEAELARMR
ncbi:MAG: prolyl oligopeptidase family serine peptidase [Gemmatimonadota bacterium]